MRLINEVSISLATFWKLSIYFETLPENCHHRCVVVVAAEDAAIYLPDIITPRVEKQHGNCIFRTDSTVWSG